MICFKPRSFRSVSRFCAGALFASIVFALPAAAQDEGGDAAAEGPAEPKVIPTIRTNIYDRMTAAQACIDEGDLECAERELDRVANIRDLNNYEIAQLWNFRAFLYFETDNFDGAVEAYESILALPHADMPDGMIQQSMRNLATLYLELERFEEGLETYLEYMALPTVTPSSGDYYLLATIYYQVGRYTDGIPAIQEAIAIANANGNIGEEPWYQLLYVFYFELEQTDKVIETLTFMVENWTKRQWILALAGQLSAQDRQEDTLVLYESAYDAGFLERGSELVQLASLHMNLGAFYKAAVILQDGLDSGVIESEQKNWQQLSQAWQYAKEDSKALPALERASSLAEDGEVDALIAQSMLRLARYDECVEAARDALDRGGLDRPGYVNLQLGTCLLNLKRYDEARAAFQAAARDDNYERDARRFLTYIDLEVARERANAEALASVLAQ